MRLQSHGSPNCWNFETPTWDFQDKKPFGCGPRGELQSILYGGRWWLPPSPSRGESCESRIARGCPSNQGVPENDLTNWVVGLMQVRGSN
jgi:hypothetical protein